MKKIQLNRLLLVAFLLGVVPALAQESENTGAYPFRSRDNYDESRFGSYTVTIKTTRGEKALRVSFAKLRVVAGKGPATIKLPERGLVLLQPTAGAAQMQIGREKFAALEGEWLRLPLPTTLIVSTDDDSILMDALLIEE
jgi:hypothetical protein